MLIDDICESFKNRTRPDIRWKMVGDMHRRIDFIQQTFTGVQTITEFGPFQGCSTAAWLSLRPKKFVTVDQGISLDVDLYKKAAQEINVDFQFIQSSDLEIDIEPCELLFIDTVHTAEHTYQELQRHADKISQYLVFHDVAEPRFRTLAGIRNWWKFHPEWKLKYQDSDDCGFLVLEKN
jgi:predicted dithiol-disulfide oxidoreductase (DUF899 family)